MVVLVPLFSCKSSAVKWSRIHFARC